MEATSHKTICECIFGLEQVVKKVDMVEIRWLSGQVDQLKNLEVNQLYMIQEGGKILKSGPLTQAKSASKAKPWPLLTAPNRASALVVTVFGEYRQQRWHSIMRHHS